MHVIPSNRHLQQATVDTARFRCAWRNCTDDTVYKYKSHLTLHLRCHLIVNNQVNNDEILSNKFRSSSGVEKKTDVELSLATNEIICNEGDRLACPEQCGAVSRLTPNTLASI